MVCLFPVCVGHYNLAWTGETQRASSLFRQKTNDKDGAKAGRLTGGYNADTLVKLATRHGGSTKAETGSEKHTSATPVPYRTMKIGRAGIASLNLTHEEPFRI